jgi:hypothetical protein
VLFSSSEVAKQINANLEPVWESVRPAPMVTIDFGNGHVVRRTLQGNVATYVCGPNGSVYDVLPGIYTPDIYREQLTELRKLADSLRHVTATRGAATFTERMRANWTLAHRLREYHKLREAKLSAPTVVQTITPEFTSLKLTGDAARQYAPRPQPAFSSFSGSLPGNFSSTFSGTYSGVGFGFQPQPQPITPQMQSTARTGGSLKGGGFMPSGGFGNIGGFQFSGFPPPGIGGVMGQPFSGIEGPLARVIVGAPRPAMIATPPAGPLASRPELKLDAEVNERIRRKAVHAHLAPLGLVQPADIKKWLFKEVLHADLDDPKLGLSELLDSNYPFVEEDRALKK